MSKRRLRKLAKSIFEQTRHGRWVNGKTAWFRGQLRPGYAWPDTLTAPNWHGGMSWNLSPEVWRNGRWMRVCISWDPEWSHHLVHVFMEGESQCDHYKSDLTPFFGCRWSWKVARDGMIIAAQPPPEPELDIFDTLFGDEYDLTDLSYPFEAKRSGDIVFRQGSVGDPDE